MGVPGCIGNCLQTFDTLEHFLKMRKQLLAQGSQFHMARSPHEERSAEFAARYKAVGAEGTVRLIVAKGQGHNYWEGFFRCQELIDFTIARALAGKEARDKGKS